MWLIPLQHHYMLVWWHFQYESAKCHYVFRNFKCIIEPDCNCAIVIRRTSDRNCKSQRINEIVVGQQIINRIHDCSRAGLFFNRRIKNLTLSKWQIINLKRLTSFHFYWKLPGKVMWILKILVKAWSYIMFIYVLCYTYTILF